MMLRSRFVLLPLQCFGSQLTPCTGQGTSSVFSLEWARLADGPRGCFGSGWLTRPRSLLQQKADAAKMKVCTTLERLLSRSAHPAFVLQEAALAANKRGPLVGGGIKVRTFFFNLRRVKRR